MGLEAWTEERFAREDRLLEELRAEIVRREWPAIQVSPTLGRLLHLLVRLAGARRVLEIGTLAGYSALWMARALPAGGRLITLELREERAEVARRFAERAGLGDVVQVRVGEALALLAEIGPDRSLDVIFIDADKESYPAYLGEARRLLRPGGLLLADNAYWKGNVLDPDPEDEAHRGITEFAEALSGDDAFEATVIPIRDGLALGIRGP